MPLNAFGAAKQRVAPFRDLASASSLVLPGDWDRFRLTGSTTVVTILAPIQAGRVIHFTGPSSGTVTLTNNADTTTSGQMNLGSGNIALSADDHETLIQRSDGHWDRFTEAANT